MRRAQSSEGRLDAGAKPGQFRIVVVCKVYDLNVLFQRFNPGAVIARRHLLARNYVYSNPLPIPEDILGWDISKTVFN